METKMAFKNTQKFNCDLCDFNCNKKSEWNRHIKRKKHLVNINGNNVNKMMKTTSSNQNRLLKIIDELFVFSLNPVTKRKEVVVNPTLDEAKLQSIVENTRKIIVNLYINCEDDFLKGLELFEAIVEKTNQRYF